MAMQTGMGLSKILILVGTGYTSTILVKNGKLSDILGEIQSLVKGMEKNGESSESDSDVSDAIASQGASVSNGGPATGLSMTDNCVEWKFCPNGNMTSLIVPATAVGALCYGCMWWKGLTFSDLMYVTKRNMASAVSNLTKHLESVSKALAVTDVRGDLSQIGFDLDALQRMVSGLDGKICSLEDRQISPLERQLLCSSGDSQLPESQAVCKIAENPKSPLERKLLRSSGGKILGRQKNLPVDSLISWPTIRYLGLEIIKYLKTTRTMDLVNLGVLYLCNFVDGRKVKMPEVLQEQLKLFGKPRGYLNSSKPPSLMDLKEIADSLVSENANRFITDGTMQEGIERLDDRPRTLVRFCMRK
ncbi:unnamed protein product [Camellia sinensis]